jgi:DNA-binding response OmpR family regulator
VSGKKILLIDDDKAIHAVVRAALGRAGHRVFTAVDAMQGPMFARQVEPDLVILDINLPGGGGEKVFDRLRSLPATAGLPILIYSAVARSDFVSTIEETQDTVFLAKPATPEAIVAAVERLLGAG